jgi:hypothetical protein
LGIAVHFSLNKIASKIMTNKMKKKGEGFFRWAVCLFVYLTMRNDFCLWGSINWEKGVRHQWKWSLKEMNNVDVIYVLYEQCLFFGSAALICVFSILW